MSDGRYVTNADLFDAVAGHELEVLHAVGIDWGSGSRTHIDCPYPDHGGKNDWRFDGRLAYCTCIGKRPGDKKAHSIVRVVEVKENLGNDAAKIRIAEIIGRADLIRRRRGSGQGGEFQKMDAASLLSPLGDKRDNNLVPKYLGSRLGIATYEVPEPTTSVVGWRELPYWERGGNDKPNLVATLPCLAFKTIDRDGKFHAHLIYTSPDGLAKPDLGEDRGSKKSARVTDGDNISGRAVLWGNRDTATLAILTEGIETGCAVAYAFRTEIEGGSCLVAACINAGGVEAFKPWPATTAVIVAADRDEGVNPDGKPRSRRGERAARGFCLRAHLELKTGYALPGEAGDYVDWLEILRRRPEDGGGVDGVRNGILAAAEFVPNAEELQKHAERQRSESELQRIEAEYPLPKLNSLLTYQRTQTGEIWAHRGVMTKEGPDYLPFATPFAIKARLRRVGGRHDAYSLRIGFQNRDGRAGEVDIECGSLAGIGARNVMSELLSAGLRTDNKGNQEVIAILSAFNPTTEVLIVQQPGWHFDIPGCSDPVFVAPSGEVCGAPAGVTVELDTSMRLRPDTAKAGSLEGWQAAVRAAVMAPSVPHWTLGACANFAGVLLSLARMQSCGIDLSGHTSGGKSLAQEIAASGWATPDKHRPGSLLQMANNTENSIEVAAKRATGTGLVLDELRLVTGKALAQIIYTLAGGTGKKRANVDMTLRDTITWSVFILLSCEHSLADKIRGDGVEYDPGISVRIVDANIDGFNRAVDAPTLAAIGEINRNYGHAGPAFVQKLVERGDHRRASEIQKSIIDAAATLAGMDSDPAMKRAAIPFALLTIAGNMAKEFGILPAETNLDAIKTLWERFRLSAEAEVLEPEVLMVRNLASWVARGWDVTVKSVTEQTGVNNRDTWAWYDDNAVYIPKDRIQQASGNAMKESQIGAALNRMALLGKHRTMSAYATV